MKCARCDGLAVADYFCGGETRIEAWSAVTELILPIGHWPRSSWRSLLPVSR